MLEQLVDVNVLGTVATVRAFLPQLRSAGGERRILLTTSTSALYAMERMAAYTASKYAVMGYAETLRIELAPENIGVTTLIPAGMATTHVQSSAAAKPTDTPAFAPQDLEIIGGHHADYEAVTPEHAVRNVIRDLRANHPYIVTHLAHRTWIDERMTQIWAAFDRSN